MSRLSRSLWCFAWNGWFHFWNACLIQFGNLQYSEFSIKFHSTLPDCCKRSNAVFSPLHRLDIPLQGKCAAWPSFWTCLFPVSSFLCASNSDHRFLFNLLLRHTALLCAPRSRFALSTVSVPFSPLHSFALVTQRPLIRSFFCSKTDRPSRTSGICRLQNCRCSSVAFSFHNILPASSTL